MTASYRIICALSAGLGCFCGLCANRWSEKTFQVKAQVLDPERTPGCAHYQNPHLKSRFAKYGLPQRDVTLRYTHFQMSYDQKNRLPNWVLEHLNRIQLNTSDNCPMSKSNFNLHWDRTVSREFQSDGIDYEKEMFTNNLADFSNYVNSTKGIIDIYTRTNSVPQNFDFQMGIWADLETFCRYLTEIYDGVYVFSGPLFEPIRPGQMEYQVSRTNHLAYPTHYYKIIIGKTDNDFCVGCYLLPNRRIGPVQELAEFRVELSVLENKVGFKLFKDGVNLPETLPNILDFRHNLQIYMPNEEQEEIIEPIEDPFEGAGDQNGHNGNQNGHLG